MDVILMLLGSGADDGGLLLEVRRQGFAVEDTLRPGLVEANLHPGCPPPGLGLPSLDHQSRHRP
jgi:hypothetical protein